MRVNNFNNKTSTLDFSFQTQELFFFSESLVSFFLSFFQIGGDDQKNDTQVCQSLKIGFNLHAYKERKSMCACVCERERVRVGVFVRVHVAEREKERERDARDTKHLILKWI